MAPSAGLPNAGAQDVTIRNKNQSPIQLLADHLETPSLDDRSYRVILLPNQMEVLLVHDAETDKASAALDVNVGNFTDEDEMPGMAHAVEHVGSIRIAWTSSCLLTHSPLAPVHGHQEISSRERV
jgi:hypothetical protein